MLDAPPNESAEPALRAVAPRGLFAQTLANHVLDVPFEAAAVLMFVLALVLAVAGGLSGHLAGFWGWNSEWGYGAFASAFVLVIATLVTWATSVSASRDAGWLLALAGLFFFMASDELAQIHEHLERVTGIDWQVLYIPVVLLGAVVWYRVLASLAGQARFSRVLLIAGAAAWVIAQVFEKLEYDSADRPITGHPIYYGLEETLEITGSGLFVLALLWAGRVWTRRRTPVLPLGLGLDSDAEGA